MHKSICRRIPQIAFYRYNAALVGTYNPACAESKRFAASGQQRLPGTAPEYYAGTVLFVLSSGLNETNSDTAIISCAPGAAPAS